MCVRPVEPHLHGGRANAPTAENGIQLSRTSAQTRPKLAELEAIRKPLDPSASWKYLRKSTSGSQPEFSNLTECLEVE